MLTRILSAIIIFSLASVAGCATFSNSVFETGAIKTSDFKSSLINLSSVTTDDSGENEKAANDADAKISFVKFDVSDYSASALQLSGSSAAGKKDRNLIAALEGFSEGGKGKGSKKSYPMNPYNIWGHAAFWSGIGFAAFGGIATWQAMDQAAKHKNDLTDTKNKNAAWTGLAYTGYALGAGLMAAGVTLWVLSPGDKEWAESQKVSFFPFFSKDGAAVSLQWSW